MDVVIPSKAGLLSDEKAHHDVDGGSRNPLKSGSAF